MSDEPSRALRACLDTLSAGDLDIVAARSTIRAAMRAGAQMVDRAYVALRDAAWRMVSTREATEDLAQWYDLQMHASALARDAERADIAERLATLAELIAQTGRFTERQPVDEVLSRKHVVDLLVTLDSHGGIARRAQLAEVTGLADANLSRLLALLGVHGLIRRARSGKEAIISLSESGRQAAVRAGASGRGTSAPTTAWWEAFALPIAVWDGTGVALGSSQAFRDLTSRAGAVGASAFDRGGWRDWLASASRGERPSSGGESRAFQFNDQLWIDVREMRLTDGQHAAVLMDVSDDVQRTTKLESKIVACEQLIAKLRQGLAVAEGKIAAAEARAEESERRLITFITSVGQLRSELVGNAANLGRKLRDCLEMLNPHARYYKTIHQADEQVVAIKQAMEYFMAAPRLPKATLPPLALAETDLAMLMHEQVDLVKMFYRPDIEILGVDLLPRVRANPEALRAAIGQAMLAHIREGQAKHYWIKTGVQKNILTFLMFGSDTVTKALTVESETLGSVSSEEMIFECGYAGPRDWATSIGGNLYAGAVDKHTFIKMELPVKVVPQSRRTATISEL